MSIDFDRDLCPDKVTLEDLVIAYRKAKVDAYYTPNADLMAIAEYEDDLENNLKVLLEKIESGNDSWIYDEGFVGDWSVKTKGISFPDKDNQNDSNIMSSNPSLTWKKQNKDNSAVASFRLIAKPSMGFNILSALWIMKVGTLFDSKLSENSYGSRVRVDKEKNYNKYSIGSFVHYMENYQKWRNKASDCMKNALDKDKNIIAITSDISGFYHNIDPGFLLDEWFLSCINIKLSYTKRLLTDYLVTAIKFWTKKSPAQNGLPIDLSASQVIANIALYHLDDIIEKEVCPLYYGRYVDDIILVLDNSNKFTEQNEVFNWLTSKSIKSYDSKHTEIKLKYFEKNKELHFVADYLKESNIVFKNKKNKLFFIDSKTGKHLVSSIISQMRIETSEWRTLPELPEDIEDIESMVISAVSESGNVTTNLRNTDSISLKRSSFAITLRSFETYARDLPADRWAEKRNEFYKSCLNFMLVLPGFFELAGYFPRVISLAVSCKDYEYLIKLVKGLNEIYELVEEIQKVKLSCHSSGDEFKYKDKILEKWKKELSLQINQIITSAYIPGENNEF